MLAGSSAFSEPAAPATGLDADAELDPDAGLDALDPVVAGDDCTELLEELQAAIVSTAAALAAPHRTRNLAWIT
jgi:hypothetical protein